MADFVTSMLDFECFLKAAKQDLSSKREALKEQRKLIQQRHSTIKNYLNCQLFMIAKHEKRIDRFEDNITTRFANICQSLQIDLNEERLAYELKKQEKVKNERNKKIEKIEQDDEEEIQTCGDLSESNESVFQLLSDMSKMKTRCKHILDVTDRYCVLHPNELRLKQLEQKPISLSTSDLSSIDETDSPVRRVSFKDCEVKKSSSPVPPHQLTQNIVKSTLESFGSHLAVIAKTYTRKRGLARNLSFHGVNSTVLSV